MPVIDFKKKLNFHRQFGASAEESAQEFLVNQAFESDRGRITVSYTHLRAHETGRNLVCRLLLEKKKKT